MSVARPIIRDKPLVPLAVAGGGLLLLVLLGSAGAAGEQRDGKQVYDAACAACHASGVLQAPRAGVRDDWVERESQGFDVLLEHVLKGYRNMPAKGGNPTIPDDEIDAAIRYMLAASGFEQYRQAAATAADPPAQQGTAASDPPRAAKPAPQAGVNRFNRLMPPPTQWNLPPAKDGIHDPDNPGTHWLQEPRVAFESLSRSRSGNRVDWVEALEAGEIAPRYDLVDADARPVVMDLNIVREVKGSMPDVVYPHQQHTEWLDCSNCHPAIFIPQKGANQISMASILLGRSCGVCHGKVAFPVSECRKCHSRQKQVSGDSANAGAKN